MTMTATKPCTFPSPAEILGRELVNGNVFVLDYYGVQGGNSSYPTLYVGGKGVTDPVPLCHVRELETRDVWVWVNWLQCGRGDIKPRWFEIREFGVDSFDREEVETHLQETGQIWSAHRKLDDDRYTSKVWVDEDRPGDVRA